MGVSLGMMIWGVGVSVGGMVGGTSVSVAVGVGVGTVGVGMLRLNLICFSTSVLSPTRVRRSEIIPFGRLDIFQE